MFCTYGFSAARRAPAISWVVTRPDGSTQRTTRNLSGIGTVALTDWVARPSDPAGLYRIRATQGSTVAQTTFEVVTAEMPQLVVLDDTESFVPVQRLGRALDIAAGGMPPRGRAWLDFYRARDDFQPGASVPFRYLNSVRVRARDDGTLLYRLVTGRTDRAGVYQVTLRRGRAQLALGCFTLVRRGESGACPST